MLKIFNDLSTFFEDCYVQFTIREYARWRKISPPTASKWLNSYARQKLLLKTKGRNMLLFSANRTNQFFIKLSQLYWFSKLTEIGLLEFLNDEFVHPLIILFGSLAKAETTKNSDVDIAIITSVKSKPETHLHIFEKKLKRNIQLFIFPSLSKIPSNLKPNILNGYVLSGKWRSLSKKC